MTARSGAVVFLALAACARTEHTPVDLELDVEVALPAAASNVRICETDGIARTFGAGDGRYALTGLTPVSPEVTVDLLDGAGLVIGRVGPIVLEEPYVVASLDACDACPPCIGGGSAAQDPAALGVRFRAADDRGP